jgi:IclR family KDG regulon transcriptional repressor
MPRKRLARVVAEAGEAVSRRLGWSEDVMSLQKES